VINWSQIKLMITIAIVSLIIKSDDSFHMMSCSPFPVIEKMPLLFSALHSVRCLEIK